MVSGVVIGSAIYFQAFRALVFDRTLLREPQRSPDVISRRSRRVGLCRCGARSRVFHNSLISTFSVFSLGSPDLPGGERQQLTHGSVRRQSSRLFRATTPWGRAGWIGERPCGRGDSAGVGGHEAPTRYARARRNGTRSRRRVISVSATLRTRRDRPRKERKGTLPS